MSIIGQCGECGHKFQAPNHLVGKRIKCPNCSTPLRIEPADSAEDHVCRQASPVEKSPSSPEKTPSSPEKTLAEPDSPPPSDRSKGGWYVQTSDGQHHGPIEKAQLDKLAAAGRLEGFCRVRREDWDNWRWAEDIYPQLASSPKSCPDDERPSENAKPDRLISPPNPLPPTLPSPISESRLVTCPDCDKTVSRRASQCPNCGCPAAILSQQSPFEETSPPVAPTERGPRLRGLVFWFVTAGAVVAMIVVATVSTWAWNRWRAVKPLVDQIETLVGEGVPPPSSPEPTGEVLTPEALRQTMQEAAAEWAKKVDSYYRKAHLATSLIGQTQGTVDLIEALAGGNLDAIPDAAPADPGKVGAEQYQSEVKSLYEECLQYLAQNVSPEKANRSSVRAVAKRWADAKQAALDKDLEKLLGF